MFSVVTISFNQSDYLERAIRSVVSELTDNDEYFVLDGGSNDGSEEIITRHESRISYWRSRPDGGPAAALNEGLGRATKSYFLYINADDMLLPGRLSKLRGFIGEHPGYAVYYGNGVTLDERSGATSRRYSDRWSHLDYAVGLCSIVQQSTAIRVDAIRGVGGFRETNRTCWDGELLFDISINRGSFCRFPFELGVFRIHDTSITGSAANGDRYRADRERIAQQCGMQYRHPDSRGRFDRMFERMRRPRQVAGRLACALKDLIPGGRYRIRDEHS